ncbi:MAG: bifunctional (p)ppGpp synthetase/guanosine-3',5'-bis(diphosphate) 3'-pyrophosphohydrolase [Clostridia bacterium]|nr:bifunctional (p)ppGpp synthetase/guanosine-3',5'-bis(diphosphate) 3'-pyrophosphohydrolase [Clostridia bacterium]MBR1704361.1 bifunctional (p)ppGpp synthetase/guanosine-3',5'-bis(diphosphate) 3'-pyrophosphohydrolase [Clostridia bacterium]
MEVERTLIKYNDRFDELRQLMKDYYTADELKLVEKAYEIASEAHKDQRRYSGEPYIMHPVAVARILFDLGMDHQSIIAAILHDTVEDTDITLTDLSNVFGEEVAQLVNGVTKLGKVPLATYKEQQAENVRKMLIAMSQDIRVIIIKLADRLHNMRTLEYMREQKQKEKSLETLEIYAPIAHRLGISSIKEELEDLAIRYLDPYGYNTIEDLLKSTGDAHPTLIDDTVERVRERVQKYIPEADVAGRRKSIYGIYRKMFIRGHSFDQIYDVYAIRIIVNNVADCYNVLGVVHDMYHSLPGRFKDYISNPKSNMYQSLHTTVISEEGIPFEVQIRTWEMHYTAEYGIAAHWKYKTGVKNDQKFEERLAWIRQLLENQKDSDDVEEIVKTIKSDFVPEDVFVFTPKGDVINIPLGSTVIDFAYAIHTQVGHHMNGAKVDGKIVPLDYKVRTGEIVEILRSPDPNKGPSRDWLNIAKTSSARSKIRSWFKKERRSENIEEGKRIVEEVLRRHNLHLSDEEVQAVIEKFKVRKGFESEDDFYAAVGYGSITAENVLPTFREEYQRLEKQRRLEQPTLEEELTTGPLKKGNSGDGIVIDGVDNVLIKLSKCCNPLPGDRVIGFITRGHGISVHKRDCTNVPHDLALASEPDRWIPVHWSEEIHEQFEAGLNIYCEDQVGMLAKITADLAAMRVNISTITLHNKEDYSTIHMRIVVKDVGHLESLISHLRNIKGVHGVERTGL